MNLTNGESKFHIYITINIHIIFTSRVQKKGVINVNIIDSYSIEYAYSLYGPGSRLK